MNNSIILQKMAQEAAEATGIFAKALDHIKNNRYTYGGAGIGALAGGAGAALATKNKKNRLRNTLLGALGGGAAGAGVGYMGQQNHNMGQQNINLRNQISSNESIYKKNLDDLLHQRDQAMEAVKEMKEGRDRAISLRDPNSELFQKLLDEAYENLRTGRNVYRGI